MTNRTRPASAMWSASAMARPLSKLKRWSLEEIVRRSSLAQLADEKTTAAEVK